jgi:hypothetical protein
MLSFEVFKVILKYAMLLVSYTSYQWNTDIFKVVL